MFSIRVAVLICVIFLSYGFGFRETYAGLFREDDRLVVKDKFYRPRVPFKIAYGYYHKKLDCPITFIKVTDRLRIKPGPTAEIIKGGLQHHHVVILIGSVYNKPTLVNVYIGCENISNKSAQNTSVEAS